MLIMLECKKHRVSVLLASFFFAWLVAGFVYSQDLPTKSATVPAPQVVTALPAARSQAMPQQELDRKEADLRQHYIEGPLGEVSNAVRLAAPQPNLLATTVSNALGTVSILTNHALTNTETNNGTSTVSEPSVAVRGSEILFTGNWFAAFSGDGGTTFSYVNPATSFPAITGQPFCCDQVAIYDPSHDLMIWFLQYVKDANGNTVRVAVAKGNDIPTQQWRFYSFTPQNVGGWNNEWFDYPELAVSAEFLYITINTFTTQTNSFTRAVILRLPLNELAAYQGFNYRYFDTDQNFSLRPTHGAIGTMYFGSHVTTNTIRVFTWLESSTSISSDDVAVDVWSSGARVAPGPDGRDWLGRVDSRITAAWASGNDIGFGWTAAQDNDFPFPQVRVAILNKNTKVIRAQPHLSNPQFAFAYPAVAPNASGVLGISVSYGGGSQLYPSHAVGVFDNSTSTWALIKTANGTHGPSSNLWGDYLALRPHGTDPESWVATGFTLQGGSSRANIVPRYIHFDQPSEPELEVSFENLEPNNKLSKGETLIVRATVKRNGVPSVGESVTFTSDNTNLASITPASVLTNANGVAEATVRGETSSRRTTTVNAEAGGVTKTVSIRVPDLSVIGLLFLITGMLLLGAFRRRSESL